MEVLLTAGTTFTVTNNPSGATATGSIFTISSESTMATGNATGVLGSVPTSAALTSQVLTQVLGLYF